jgi:hypothetical protein
MSGNSSRGCVGHLISRAKTTLRRECPNRQRLPSRLGGVLMMGVGVGSRASPPSCTTIRTGSGRPRWSRQPGRPAASGTSSACSGPSANGRCARAGVGGQFGSSRRRGSWSRRWGCWRGTMDMGDAERLSFPRMWVQIATVMAYELGTLTLAFGTYDNEAEHHDASRSRAHAATGE